jgi:hypothetical protein
MPKRAGVLSPISPVPLKKPAAVIKSVPPIPPLKPGAQPVKRLKKVVARRTG